MRSVLKSLALIACFVAVLVIGEAVSAAGVPGRVHASEMTVLSGTKIQSSEGGKAAYFKSAGVLGLVADAPADGLYKVYVRVASGTGGEVSLSNGDACLFRVPNTGSPQNYITLSDYIPLQQGVQILQFDNFKGDIAVSWVDFIYCLPGSVEAEGYTAAVGAKLRDISDGGDDGEAMALTKNSILRYTVDVPSAGLYKAEFRVTGRRGSFEFKEDGTSRGIVDIPDSKGKWVTAVKELSLTPGRHILNIVSNSNDWSLDGFRITSPARPLHVEGNRILDDQGRVVRLLGVNVASLEWTAKGERVLRSSAYACDSWNSNLIRLPINCQYWLEDADGYRDTIHRVIELVSSRGKYIDLDMHGFLMPGDNDMKAWGEIAEIYGKNPAVLFGLFNEPHDTSWNVWKDGGKVASSETGDYQTPGMQALVSYIRTRGAENILILGGLDWAFDLKGIAGKYAVNDPLKQIVYDTHVYPFKPREWDKYVTLIADRYPILVGEFGCDPINDPAGVAQYPGGASKYMNDILTWIDKNSYSMTAWCFHPSAGPILITDWSYEPSLFHGRYVMGWLYSHGSIQVADGKPLSAGDGWLMIDLGVITTVKRWVVRSTAGSSRLQGRSVSLQTSTDGVKWVDIDFAMPTSKSGNDSIDRIVKPFQGRYVRITAVGGEITSNDCTIELWQ